MKDDFSDHDEADKPTDDEDDDDDDDDGAAGADEMDVADNSDTSDADDDDDNDGAEDDESDMEEVCGSKLLVFQLCETTRKCFGFVWSKYLCKYNNGLNSIDSENCVNVGFVITEGKKLKVYFSFSCSVFVISWREFVSSSKQ